MFIFSAAIALMKFSRNINKILSNFKSWREHSKNSLQRDEEGTLPPTCCFCRYQGKVLSPPDDNWNSQSKCQEKGFWFQTSKARQTRFVVTHQLLTRFACGWAVIIHYSNTTYTWQIYSIMSIKSGHVTAWKAIMTTAVAGLRGCKRWCEKQ